MMHTEAEYEKAREWLRQSNDVIQMQRGRLEEMGLGEEDIQRALGPMVSFRDQLREEMEAYQDRRRAGA